MIVHPDRIEVRLEAMQDTVDLLDERGAITPVHWIGRHMPTELKLLHLDNALTFHLRL